MSASTAMIVAQLRREERMEIERKDHVVPGATLYVSDAIRHLFVESTTEYRGTGDPESEMAPKTIAFRTERGVIAYSAVERPQYDGPGRVANGLLGGEPALVAIVRQILAGSLPKSVRVAEPNLDYVFTASRDTLADVAAAMLVAGNGRGRLSDSGWDAIDAALVGETGLDATRPDLH